MNVLPCLCDSALPSWCSPYTDLAMAWTEGHQDFASSNGFLLSILQHQENRLSTPLELLLTSSLTLTSWYTQLSLRCICLSPFISFIWSFYTEHILEGSHCEMWWTRQIYDAVPPLVEFTVKEGQPNENKLRESKLNNYKLHEIQQGKQTRTWDSTLGLKMQKANQARWWVLCHSHSLLSIQLHFPEVP